MFDDETAAGDADWGTCGDDDGEDRYDSSEGDSEDEDAEYAQKTQQPLPTFVVLVGARWGYKQASCLYLSLQQRLAERSEATDAAAPTPANASPALPHLLLLGGARPNDAERQLLRGLRWTHLSNSPGRAAECPDRPGCLAAALAHSAALVYLSNAEVRRAQLAD